MGCCCKATYYRPSAIIVGQYDNGGNLTGIQNATVWNDTYDRACKQCKTERKTFWQFAVNNVIMYEVGPGVLGADFPIGVSTFNQVTASVADITNYLQWQGVAIVQGDSVKVKIIAENCNGLTAHSNVIELVADPQHVCEGWVTIEQGNAHSLEHSFWITLEKF